VDVGARRSILVIIPTAFLIIAAVLLAVSIAMAMDRPGGYTGALLELIALPGRFLFAGFLWTAFFIPLYLLVNAFLLCRFNRRAMVAVILTLFPFITVSLLVKVVFGQEYQDSLLSAQIRSALGTVGGGLLLFFCLIIQVIVIALVTQNMKGGRAGSGTHGEYRGSPRIMPTALPASIPVSDQRSPAARDALRLPLLQLPRFGPGTEDRDSAAQYATQEPAADSQPQMEYDLSEAESDLGPAAPEDASSAFTPEASSVTPAAAMAGRGGERTGYNKTKTSVKRGGAYSIPLNDILREYDAHSYWEIDAATRSLAEVLKNTLEEFKIQAEVTGIQKGPVITMFEILPAPGVKLSKIVNLADNIALRLAASRVRIVAPIPGKQAVGIEIPNKHRSLVSLKQIVTSSEFMESKYEIPLALGMDITGNIQVVDLAQMPHLLIAGATGSGKSVCVNSIICSVLCKRSPEEVKLLLIDPKIVELKYYNDIPHLLTPVITEAKRAFQALQYCISEMERRYSLLDSLCVRDIRAYNKKIKKKHIATTPLPYIVIVIDEFADLIATSGKEMESILARLAAMSRAVGIHLALATQRPSIDVITGLIKANIPSRVAFMVASKFDSRIIIDAVGAEKLLGQGDMLFVSSWYPFPTRIQGAYISEEEVEELIAYVKGFGEPEYIDDEIFIDEDEDGAIFEGEADPLADKALDIILASGKASTSYLQRKLKIGYNRAARLVEELELRGIVGPPNGSKPREILHVPDKP
jgi:S-DNA-T family DNA segregation ATPase FtsK/SpoIIIE